MIKKRTRPQQRIRGISIDRDEPHSEGGEAVRTPPIEDLLEYRKLKQRREGIDVGKLNAGDIKKRRKKDPEEEDVVMTQGGLKQGAKPEVVDEEEAVEEQKSKRVMRSNNFTQQTNALDVDKHMMAYIEENMKSRRQQDDSDEDTKPSGSPDSKDALHQLADKYKAQQKQVNEEGNVTNSLAMLTAIPEVDLGLDARLKNIEETEKAKRAVADERKERSRAAFNDEEHLAAARFFKPNLRQKSDADILRDARLEAMGLPAEEYEPRRSQHDRPLTATDEMVMERFKKRMRK